jgi:uncharacterized protein DUF4336
MHDDAAMTYPPLDTPKAVAQDAWIVDGPLIRFGAPWPRMPFPTRMTLLRIGGDLLVHSPTRLTPSLRAQVDALGTPRWIVAPNRIHYWWIPDWHAQWNAADVWLAPRVREQAGSRIGFPARALEVDHGYPWDEAIATLPVAGTFMTEVVFLHRASSTLVLTDLIENFEPGHLALPMRWLTRLGGVQAPHGSTPRDLRRTFDRARLRAAVERMLAWNPDHVVFAHGRWFERDGTERLRRSFRWLLEG